MRRAETDLVGDGTFQHARKHPQKFVSVATNAATTWMKDEEPRGRERERRERVSPAFGNWPLLEENEFPFYVVLRGITNDSIEEMRLEKGSSRR